MSISPTSLGASGTSRVLFISWHIGGDSKHRLTWKTQCAPAQGQLVTSVRWGCSLKLYCITCCKDSLGTLGWISYGTSFYRLSLFWEWSTKQTLNSSSLHSDCTSHQMVQTLTLTLAQHTFVCISALRPKGTPAAWKELYQIGEIIFFPLFPLLSVIYFYCPDKNLERE